MRVRRETEHAAECDVNMQVKLFGVALSPARAAMAIERDRVGETRVRDAVRLTR